MTAGGGRNLIAVIGIDRYDCPEHWPTLDNAVNDALGAEALFGKLGFEPAAALAQGRVAAAGQAYPGDSRRLP
jgi:hypothetical protein